jgi:hypothetical protein
LLSSDAAAFDTPPSAVRLLSPRIYFDTMIRCDAADERLICCRFEAAAASQIALRVSVPYAHDAAAARHFFSLLLRFSLYFAAQQAILQRTPGCSLLHDIIEALFFTHT